jgi:hypothetical protein
VAECAASVWSSGEGASFHYSAVARFVPPPGSFGGTGALAVEDIVICINNVLKEGLGKCRGVRVERVRFVRTVRDLGQVRHPDFLHGVEDFPSWAVPGVRFWYDQLR